MQHGNVDDTSAQVMVVSRPKSRLPELQLPNFSGAYTEWNDFYSLFKTIVHDEAELTQIEKFQHLKTCVKGAASEVIRSIEVTNDNYNVALDLLKRRFDNKRLIFQAHVREIFGLKRVDSASNAKLRELIDRVRSHMRALQTIATKEQIADGIIIHLLLQKVDTSLQTKWEERSDLHSLPTSEDLEAFLEKRCQTMESVEIAMSGNTSAHASQASKTKISNYQKRSFVAANVSKSACVFCDSGDHLIYNCPAFNNLSPTLRFKEVKKLNLCLNCLKAGHQKQSCKSGSCRNCSAKHHTLLHFKSLSNTYNAYSSSSSSEPQHTHAVDVPTSSSALTTNSVLNDVLLATAIIMVQDRAGSLVPCRALLDSGSQLHFITKRLADQLQLKKTKSTTIVSGIGEIEFPTEDYNIEIQLSSTRSNFSSTIMAVVASSIVDNQPGFTMDASNWRIPSNICLADPLFYKSQRIDLLIGAGLFFDLLCVGQIRLGPGYPILQKTRLGWIVSGGGQHAQNSSSSLVSIGKSHRSSESDSQLDRLVRSFWEVEGCIEPIVKNTAEELACEAHFAANYSRLVSGEYSVNLPMKLCPDMIGDSYQQALRRFQNLERKLLRMPELKNQYKAFIEEYADLKHMSLVKPSERSSCKFFLPHHCVIKADSTTTKLRVVFDGSASSSTGCSLNDVLMAGPTIQPHLFNTLLKFRLFLVALTGDICKMYRCVRISEPDNYFQCILWRENPNEDIKIYKLDTVTYGTKSAAFLAIRSMQQLVKDEGAAHPLGAQALLHDFYVDDMISGSDSIEEAKELLRQTTELLKLGRFNIRKWCSNNQAVLEGIPENDREKYLKFDNESDVIKSLGLYWDPASDNFLFSFAPHQISKVVSKRSALSNIARFYDPLGLIGPVIAKAKIFMQKLWRDRLDWDESLPESLQAEWLTLYGDMSSVKKISFPRYVLMPSYSVEIHAFCDASIEAYGACVYVKVYKKDKCQINLLCSKSRVAPLKSLTVPKLELCAAELLSKLIQSIVKMNIFNCEYHLWSDSSIVLSWLKEEPARFNVFVANRLSFIQQVTSGMEWHHVPTAMNPADILSKGATPLELLNSSLWMHGPSFLNSDRNSWPESCPYLSILPEMRKRILTITSPHVDISVSSKYINNFGTMQRIFGYVYKFIVRKRSNNLSTIDIQRGSFVLLRLMQRSNLWSDYKMLESNKQVHSTSNIASLSPFLDQHGLIRVGGRLQNSDLDFEARHPIILPKHHVLTNSIINYFHNKQLHAGPQSLLASLRFKYWPIGGRKTVSRAISKCVRCFRAKPRILEHIMGNLPKERVQATRSFTVTGVDYCGPFYYQPEIRNKRPTKCYISLFICFSTKALHLELVKDLSTASFLAALKRFISTRGKPQIIWSDNGTNFVGAKNDLSELRKLFLSNDHQEAVHHQCLDDDIEWKLIPPRSPHFGGLWEASVKAAKHHFYRSAANSLLNFDELRTLVCQISAIINSRPLFPLSENPDDLDVLTPAHFLIGTTFTAPMEPDVTLLNIGRLDRWQRVSYLQQIFWKRWKAEYLTLLQQRSKWRSPTSNLSIGAMYLSKMKTCHH